MDIRQGQNYARFMESLGWVVEKAGGANVFIRHFPIFSRWSVIKVQRPQSLNFQILDQIARSHRALFAKIEPVYRSTLRLRSGQASLPDYRKDNWPLLPTKTLILDLDLDLDSLPKDTRYEIRLAERFHVRVEPSQDIELFYKLLRETMKIGKWSVPIRKEVTNLWRSFQPKNSQVLLVYHREIPIGGCLLIWYGNTAHYMYAALTHEGRKYSAAYGTLFAAIEYLKKKRIKYLDLEGIYDERFPENTKNWKGFTKFKMGWGGKITEFPGSYIKYYNSVAKALFTFGNLI